MGGDVYARYILATIGGSLEVFEIAFRTFISVCVISESAVDSVQLITVGSSRVGCDFLKKVQFLHMRVKLSFYHTITFPDNTFGQLNPFATNLLRLKAKKRIFLDFENFPLHFLNKYAISNLRMKVLKNRV